MINADFFLRQLAGWVYIGVIVGCIWKMIKLIIEMRRDYYGR